MWHGAEFYLIFRWSVRKEVQELIHMNVTGNAGGYTRGIPIKYTQHFQQSNGSPAPYSTSSSSSSSSLSPKSNQLRFHHTKRRIQSRTYPRLPLPLTLRPHSPSPTSHPSPSPQTAPSHHNQHYCTLPSSRQHDCTQRAAHAVSGHYPTLDRVDGRYDQTGAWRLLLCCTCRTCA